MASDPFSAWYDTPLNGDDLLAGVSLLVLLAVFLPLYALVVRVFIRAEREIIGFRYLLSAAVADILCMVQYAGLNGIAILTKRRLVSVEARPRMQECSTHWQPFMTVFYFEPAAYGMLSDDVTRFVIILLIKRGASSTSHVQRVELLLILPCLVASVVFVLGQVAITFGTESGKWFTWSICALFFGNSAIQPFILIGFSPFVRRAMLRMFCSPRAGVNKGAGGNAHKTTITKLI
ncbi:hypothetical protein PRIPAC_96075 [Pristionchus pacificus]|uniref:Uncharacterized protein n=1 Tax=Pristionchus pacificus TaxID=54126 RepID=A0A2A6D2T8_PRIPA|nr:hypothetical protein PRIPAC_96075 [Pristionchus pacificus]|eukprot:PDM84627.1 hypothetical protein PRIPAC_33650 [Pristionchus pacificus]